MSDTEYYDPRKPARRQRRGRPTDNLFDSTPGGYSPRHRTAREMLIDGLMRAGVVGDTREGFSAANRFFGGEHGETPEGRVDTAINMMANPVSDFFHGMDASSRFAKGVMTDPFAPETAGQLGLGDIGWGGAQLATAMPGFGPVMAKGAGMLGAGPATQGMIAYGEPVFHQAADIAADKFGGGHEHGHEDEHEGQHENEGNHPDHEEDHHEEGTIEAFLEANPPQEVRQAALDALSNKMPRQQLLAAAGGGRPSQEKAMPAPRRVATKGGAAEDGGIFDYFGKLIRNAPISWDNPDEAATPKGRLIQKMFGLGGKKGPERKHRKREVMTPKGALFQGLAERMLPDDTNVAVSPAEREPEDRRIEPAGGGYGRKHAMDYWRF